MRRDPDIKDLNYQLGMYVGEYITRRFLPTLSTDAIKSYVEIEVSQEDAERHEQVYDALKDAWDIKGSSEEAFNVYKALNDELARKYLSEKLECMVPKIYPTDMEKFKEGLYDQLWNTDLSHYFPEDDFFKQGHGLGWADYVILTLKIN
jgi:hypothetical protein